MEPRAENFDDRYDPYEDLTCAEGDCEVDLDGDGNIDFTFGQPDFNLRQLRSTLVFRWEYRPGSVVFFAWQHGRSAFVNDGRYGDFGDITSLFREASDNALLVKLNYWIPF